MSLPSHHAPVSVVVPCFQCADTLDRAFQSILDQTMPPSEVILVDDGGDDATRDLLLRIAENHPSWVRLIRLPSNQGAACARNAGWGIVREPYVAFLDADDAWHPAKIEMQYALMRDNPDVALCGHGHRVVLGGYNASWPLDSARFQRLTRWQVLLSNPFITPSAMLRSNIPHRFAVQQRHMEDHMLWLTIVCSGLCIVKLSLPLAAIFKAPYGVKGLSANLWSMERGDLGNYRRLFRARYIGPFELVFLEAFSVLKFVRRLCVYWAYLRWKKIVNNQLELSISIVSHLQIDLIEKLLDDCQKYCHSVTYEVILTLNVEEKVTFNVNRYPFPVRIIRNLRPLGFGANHNQAFKVSAGHFFCVLNPDIRLKSDPLGPLKDMLEHSYAGIAAPLVLSPSGEIENSARRFPTPSNIFRRAVLGVTQNDYSISAELIFRIG